MTLFNISDRCKPLRMLLPLLTLSLGLVGCGSDRGQLEPQPVVGQVVINGEPAAGCIVGFIPVDPQHKAKFRSGGITDENGSFQLTTFETDDGAPVGDYGVTLRWEATDWPGREKEMQLDPVQPVGPDRLQGKFSSPEKSQLTVTVVEGENKLEPFRLDNVKLLKGSK